VRLLRLWRGKAAREADLRGAEPVLLPVLHAALAREGCLVLGRPKGKKNNKKK
jgi:hypothetical protein